MGRLQHAQIVFLCFLLMGLYPNLAACVCVLALLTLAGKAYFYPNRSLLDSRILREMAALLVALTMSWMLGDFARPR